MITLQIKLWVPRKSFILTKPILNLKLLETISHVFSMLQNVVDFQISAAQT